MADPRIFRLTNGRTVEVTPERLVVRDPDGSPVVVLEGDQVRVAGELALLESIWRDEHEEYP